MMSERNALGFYGKVPILADFVSRRLPARFIQPWDTWLQGALSASMDQLGSRWLDIFLTSPIWRFILSPGSCDTNAWAGVLMPSVDKVGRYFPLTLAVSLDEQEILPFLFVKAAHWFDKLEQSALSALEDDFNIDEFDRKLQEQVLTLPIQADEIYYSRQELTEKNGKTAFRLGMGKLEQVPDAFIQLSSCLLTEFLPTFSLWSTNGSELMKPSLVVYDGLPPSVAYSELLTGQWQKDGWNDKTGTSRSLPQPNLQGPLGSRQPDGSTNQIEWRSSALSTVGKQRDINEDACLERPEIGLWVVADGMGGHRDGDVASKAVVDALAGISTSDSLSTLIANVTACLQKANTDMITMAQKIGPDQIIGSTVVVMLAAGSKCAAIWAGDCRFYRHRGGVLTQLTQDHSAPAEPPGCETPAPEDTADGAHCNMVTRALGAEPELDVDTITFQADPGDTYLLCSDGLVKEVNSGELSDILNRDGCDEIALDLIDLSLARGARDNVTVIVVRAG